MKNLYGSCATLALMLMLASCGGGSTSGTVGSIPGTVTHTTLNGTWLSDCEVDPVFLPGISINASALFNNGTITLTITSFDNTTCTGNTATQETFTATYILGSDITVDGSVAGISSATKIDYIDTTLNSPDIGEQTFDIIAITGNKLYEGDDDGVNDGTTDALRPTQLLGDIVFTRQ